MFKASLGQNRAEARRRRHFRVRFAADSCGPSGGDGRDGLDKARGVYEELDRLQPRAARGCAVSRVSGSRSAQRLSAREYFEKAFAAGDADPKMCFVLSILEREAETTRGPDYRAARARGEVEARLCDALLQLGLARMAEQTMKLRWRTSTNNIATVTPERAPAVFSALSTPIYETGDVAQARVNLEKAGTWARTPVEKAAGRPGWGN